MPRVGATTVSPTRPTSASTPGTWVVSRSARGGPTSGVGRCAHRRSSSDLLGSNEMELRGSGQEPGTLNDWECNILHLHHAAKAPLNRMAYIYDHNHSDYVHLICALKIRQRARRALHPKLTG